MNVSRLAERESCGSGDPKIHAALNFKAFFTFVKEKLNSSQKYGSRVRQRFAEDRAEKLLQFLVGGKKQSQFRSFVIGSGFPRSRGPKGRRETLSPFPEEGTLVGEFPSGLYLDRLSSL